MSAHLTPRSGATSRKTGSHLEPLKTAKSRSVGSKDQPPSRWVSPKSSGSHETPPNATPKTGRPVQGRPRMTPRHEAKRII